ncbi:YjbF family lipoprotein [Vibrio paucivorans]|uniref:YjbF family lipoprotein n=1 Tax=Vibrio paucivorans TaxID=2829489 RepID=A0A9X3CCE2_9VIBR|nr:YjbF family lipoprotein [Vibrio paucivorans]MCW8332804.1 YjbF family lipoprotein [Vibrio paucivorans]
MFYFLSGKHSLRVKKIPRSIFALSFMLLTGCSQKFQGLNATIEEALYGFDDVALTKEQVQNIPYASMYVRINDGPRIFMVLAFAEKNPATGAERLKWLSADSAMIVTENGRIVKTLNLEEANIAGISVAKENAIGDNLPLPLVSSVTNWQATYDWQPNYRFGNHTMITSAKVREEKLNSLLWSRDTSLIEEHIVFSNSKSSMANQYWVDNSGNVVKSDQWLIPEQLSISYEVLKPYSSN